MLPGGDKTWIIADATITPKLADQTQELTFPAAYLQHSLAADIVAADELLGDSTVECIERGREALGFFVLIRIDGAMRVPSGIEDKAASPADRERDIAGREIQRPGSILNQQLPSAFIVTAQNGVEIVTDSSVTR